MPKGKTHKGLLKRVKITGKGKVKHKRSGSSHLMSHMTGSKVRKLRNKLVCHKSIAKKMETTLGQRLIGRSQG